MTLAKAKLTELDQGFENVKSGGQAFEVQFNPETLKVTFANAIVQPEGGDQSSGSGGRQFVGAGTTKLALTLWFDVTALQDNPVDDVRRLTQKVVYFMKPQPSDKDPKKKAPPGVQFQFGSFLFKGMVDGLEESLEFFSPEGKPLRASISLTLSQQNILESDLGAADKMPSRPGHSPLSAAKDGDSLQNMAGKKGKGDWQSIASANGIEDPLRMLPGTLIDLNAGIGGSVDVSVSADAGIGATFGAGVSAGAGLNASLGGSASASISIG